MLIEAANTRWELDALELMPVGEVVCLRLAGPGVALKEISAEILSRWPGERLSADGAESVWSGLREFSWAHPDGTLFKIPMTPALLPVLSQAVADLGDAKMHVSAGGNVAFVSLSRDAAAERLDTRLKEFYAPALTLRGNAPIWLGPRSHTKISSAVKAALDPESRFPGLEE
jgi:hypothetical protein